MVTFKILCLILLASCVMSFRTNYKFSNTAKLPSPLVLIPGDGGSRAYATIKYYFIHLKRLLWVNYDYMVCPEALTADFKLIYDPITHTTRDVDGLKVLFPGWGSTEMIEELDEWRHYSTTYFAPLVKDLIQDKFCRRNKTLRGAPFDFRKAPNENQNFVNDLKLLIEETYEISGENRIVLLGHSMGSLYSLYFLDKMTISWKKKYIRAFVSASSPLAGAAKAVLLETAGDALGSPRNPYDFREMQRSFPSTAFLLPKYSIYGDTPIVVTPKRNYSANDYEAMFKDMNFHFGSMMYNDTRNLVDGSKPPVGIDELYCIHSYGRDTIEQLIFTNFPDTYPKIKTGNGDGTVNIQSLEVCKKWPNVNYYTIKGAEHMHIVGSPEFITKLKEILYRTVKLRF